METAHVNEIAGPTEGIAPAVSPKAVMDRAIDLLRRNAAWCDDEALIEETDAFLEMFPNSPTAS